MAILSAILGLIAKELSTILQAIFGWSLTALFGKLPSKKETAFGRHGGPPTSQASTAP